MKQEPQIIELNYRNSSIESMRMMCMIFIILHHFISQVVAPGFCNRWWAGVDVFFHTSVIIFVLISGYFGIRWKTKRFIDLWFLVVFYSLILTTISITLFNVGSLKDVVQSFLPIGGHQYWFVSVYLQLMLISPLINKAIQELDKREFRLVIIVFAFFVCYLGLVCHNNVCLDGKNIINFIFIYLIGRYIRIFKIDIKKKYISLIIASIVLLICIVCILPEKHNMYLHGMAFIYQYHSPVLILLSIALFMYVIRYKFYNKVINYFATSVFSIYIIHEHPLMREYIYARPVRFLMAYLDNELLLFVSMIIFALVLSFICVAFDKIRIIVFSLWDNRLKEICDKVESIVLR